MKAIFPALPIVDSQPSELESDAAQGDAKGTGQGFDALLALAAARTATPTAPVKPLAPGLTLPQGSADVARSPLVPSAALDVLPAGLDLSPKPDASQLSVALATQPVVNAPVVLPAPLSEASDLIAPEMPSTPVAQLSLAASAPALPVIANAQPQAAEAHAPMASAELPQQVGQPALPTQPAAQAPVSAPVVAAANAPAPPAVANALPPAAEPSAPARQEASVVLTSQPAQVTPGLPQAPVVSTEQPGAATSAQESPLASRTKPVNAAPAPAQNAPTQADARSDVSVSDPPAASDARPRKSERKLQTEDERAPARGASEQSPLQLQRAESAAVLAAQAGPAPSAPQLAAKPQAAAATPITAAASARETTSQQAAASSAQAVLGVANGADQSDQPLASDDTFAGLLAPADVADSASAPQAKPADAPAQVAPLHVTSDPETGARVVGIEYFSTGSKIASGDARAPVATTTEQPAVRAQAVEPKQTEVSGSDSAQGEANALPEHADAKSVDEERNPLAEREPGTGADASDQNAQSQQEPSAGQHHAAGQGAHVAPKAFEATEAQGMRGLDAVVASLLRAGNDNPEPARVSNAERMTISAPIGQVQTQKSVSTKSAEKTASLLDEVKRGALEREEDRAETREQFSPEPPAMHAFVELKAPEASNAPAPTPDVPLPTAPVPVPDPDAAAMGKLAHGEVNGASIAIEHPELGPMKVIVQSENGRIDVRATLETPKAAAVLRAHESALRYGIQQAGMTFGALRVRSRSGEAEPVKTQGSVKRRRGQEWEA